MNPQIERIMKGLGCSAEQAQKIYEADKAIDRGERMEFDLTPEQEKKAIKYANVDTKNVEKRNYSARKRKENPAKAELIAKIAVFLEEKWNISTQITNKERQIAFEFMGNSYELTLTQKRK